MNEDVRSAFLAALGDWLHKGGIAVAWIASFVQENVALLSLGVGIAGLLVRVYFDRKEDRRRGQLFRAQLGQRLES